MTFLTRTIAFFWIIFCAEQESADGVAAPNGVVTPELVEAAYTWGLSIVISQPGARQS